MREARDGRWAERPRAPYLELVGAAREDVARRLRQPNGAWLAVLWIAQDAQLAPIVLNQTLQPVCHARGGRSRLPALQWLARLRPRDTGRLAAPSAALAV
jgi:hypothetical protein